MSHNIVITELPPSDSSSFSIIGKGTYQGKAAFFKMFNNDSKNDDNNKHLKIEGLKYEAGVYQNINSHIIRDNKLAPFFIPYLGFLTLSKTELLDIIRKSKPDVQSNIERELKMIQIDMNSNFNLDVLITGNENTIPLTELIDEFKDSQFTREAIITSVCEILYVILLAIDILHNQMKIAHNDMHLGNIRCKREKTLYYDYNNKYYFLSNYKILIYDYDRSYLEGRNNSLLGDLSHNCIKYGSCNKRTFKDYHLFIQVILDQIVRKIKNRDYNILCDILNIIFDSVVPVDYQHSYRENMTNVINNNKKLHWSGYCNKLSYNNELTMSEPCDNPEVSDIYTPWLSDIPNKFLTLIKPELESVINSEGKQIVQLRKKPPPIMNEIKLYTPVIISMNPQEKKDIQKVSSHDKSMGDDTFTSEKAKLNNSSSRDKSKSDDIYDISNLPTSELFKLTKSLKKSSDKQMNQSPLSPHILKPISSSIRNELGLSSSYKDKYIKYKNKYLKLKAKLNIM